MYRMYAEYGDTDRDHKDVDLYGNAVRRAYNAVIVYGAMKAWVIKSTGESIYIITRKEDGSIVESILP